MDVPRQVKLKHLPTHTRPRNDNRPIKETCWARAPIGEWKAEFRLDQAGQGHSICQQVCELVWVQASLIKVPEPTDAFKNNPLKKESASPTDPEELSFMSSMMSTTTQASATEETHS